MSDRPASPVPVNHVVHLVPELNTDARPPAELGYPAPFSTARRAAIVSVLLVGSVVGVGMLLPLWTGDTPGLWFQLVFTVFIGVLVVVIWSVALGSRALGRERRAAVAAWAEVRDVATAVPGRVVDRKLSIADEGDVSGFDLTVERVDGLRVSAGWVPHPRRSDYLLKSQVPAVGAPACIWSAPAHPSAPVVVDVVGPGRADDDLPTSRRSTPQT